MEVALAKNESPHFSRRFVSDLCVLSGPGGAGPQRRVHHRRLGELERLLESITGGPRQGRYGVLFALLPAFRWPFLLSPAVRTRGISSLAVPAPIFRASGGKSG